jgi:hypothetical protein
MMTVVTTLTLNIEFYQIVVHCMLSLGIRGRVWVEI